MNNMNVSVVVRAIDRMTAPFKRMSGATAPLTRSIERLKKQTAGLAKLSAVAAGAGGLMLRQFTNTAAKFEQFRAILETVEGSSSRAQKSLDWVSNFATTTPFELDQVMGSFVKLRSFGLDPMNGLLRTLGDTAAAMGKPIDQAVEAIADAVTGEYERLKEFGIKAFVKGNKTAFEYTDRNGKQMRKIVDKNNRAMIQSTLETIWNDKYAGSMDKQSKTFKGMMSNLADQWTRFQLMVMKAGLFDWMKNKLSTLLDTINRMAASGELAQLARQFGSRLLAVLKGIYHAVKAIVSVASGMAAFVGGWKNLLYILLAIKGLQIAITLGVIIRSIYGMIAAMVGLEATGAGSLLTGMATALATLRKAWQSATLAAVAYDIASSKAIKLGGLSKIGALAGRAGLVGLAGAAGYGVGTLLNSGINKLTSSLSGGKNQSLGGLIFDKLHPQAQKVGGTLHIKIDSTGHARTTKLEKNGSMDISVDNGPIPVGAG